jgi:hypothetical protein
MRPRRLLQGLIILLLNFLLLSCGDSVVPEEQAKKFLTLLQNNDIDKCVEMVYAFQANLAKLQNEPDFRKNELIIKNRNEIKEEFLNEHKIESIVYIFRFPCHWQVLEAKQVTEEIPGVPFSATSLYRVFAVVKYNSMGESPESVPLFVKKGGFKYKIKEIILHCDFETKTGLYLGWGLDEHTPW